MFRSYILRRRFSFSHLSRYDERPWVQGCVFGALLPFQVLLPIIFRCMWACFVYNVGRFSGLRFTQRFSRTSHVVDSQFSETRFLPKVLPIIYFIFVLNVARFLGLRADTSFQSYIPHRWFSVFGASFLFKGASDDIFRTQRRYIFWVFGTQRFSRTSHVTDFISSEPCYHSKVLPIIFPENRISLVLSRHLFSVVGTFQSANISCTRATSVQSFGIKIYTDFQSYFPRSSFSVVGSLDSFQESSMTIFRTISRDKTSLRNYKHCFLSNLFLLLFSWVIAAKGYRQRHGKTTSRTKQQQHFRFICSICCICSGCSTPICTWKL